MEYRTAPGDWVQHSRMVLPASCDDVIRGEAGAPGCGTCEGTANVKLSVFPFQ